MKRRKQTGLWEREFAVKVAYGVTQRKAYADVFGVVAKTPREIALLDTRASKLAGREDIASLIEDERNTREQQIKAKERNTAEKVRENLGTAVVAAQQSGDALKRNVIKATELYLKVTGQFAPQEHILKNGGSVPGAFVPPGPKGMSEDDLKGIIEAEGHSVAPLGIRKGMLCHDWRGTGQGDMR